MGDLEADTRLERVASAPPEASAGDGPARFRATLSSDWEIWGPNGGYLAAVALRAAGLEARVPRPASIAAHFLGVARFGPVDVAVTPVRRGRSTESFRVHVSQDERPVLEALVRTAAEAPGLVHDAADAPSVPAPEGLRAAEELRDPEWGDPYPFWQNLETRPLAPERFREPPRARPPVWREWYRFRPRAVFEDPFVDAGRLLVLVDTLSWPAACQPHPDAAFRAPNLDVTAWFHRLDAKSEWLLADHDCPVADGGLMGTRARVWSRDGRLLATGGAQLFCIPAQPSA